MVPTRAGAKSRGSMQRAATSSSGPLRGDGQKVKPVRQRDADGQTPYCARIQPAPAPGSGEALQAGH